MTVFWYKGFSKHKNTKSIQMSKPQRLYRYEDGSIQTRRSTVFHTIRVECSLFNILSHISSMLCAIGMRYISK